MDKANLNSRYRPNNRGTFSGYRARNMFYMKKLNSDTQYWLPNPDKDGGLKAAIATMVNSARNTKAIVTAQKIGRDQIQYQFTWSFLTISEWESLLRFWDSNFFFKFYFYDPIEGSTKSHKCYISDRNFSYYNIDSSGKPTAYIECSATITDTGD